MPIVLLDEIAAHFDPLRRAALFDELEALGGQVWMTGADDAAFAELAPTARKSCASRRDGFRARN